MDPKRLVVVSFLVFGIIIALFLDHVIDLALAGVGLNNKDVSDGLGWRPSTILGFVLSAGMFAAFWVSPKARAVCLDIATELMRVTWPTMEETRVATVAVVVASIVAAVVLFGIDTLSYHVMVDWLPTLWGKL